MTEQIGRLSRQNVLLSAEICGFGGGEPTRHRIRDLSIGGARVDRAGKLRHGTTVLVSVGTLQAVGATVIWVKDDVAGLKFAETIDVDAARSKTLISPGATSSQFFKPATQPGYAPPPTAGWVRDLHNPYRR